MAGWAFLLQRLGRATCGLGHATSFVLDHWNWSTNALGMRSV